MVTVKWLTEWTEKRTTNGCVSSPAEDISYLKADILGIGGRRHAGNGSGVVRCKPCRPEAYSMYVGGRKAQHRAADGRFSSRPLADRKRKAFDKTRTHVGRMAMEATS